MYDKESIYDEQIAPLMTEIIKIARENNINFIANCLLQQQGNEEDDLYCTTYIPSKEYESQKMIDLYNVIIKGYIVEKPFAMAVTVISK